MNPRIESTPPGIATPNTAHDRNSVDKNINNGVHEYLGAFPPATRGGRGVPASASPLPRLPTTSSARLLPSQLGADNLVLSNPFGLIMATTPKNWAFRGPVWTIVDETVKLPPS